MKITKLETLGCDAGWRNYHFLKITTDDGLVGWSEYDESFGPVGLTAVIQHYGRQLVGQDPRHHEKIYAKLFAQVIVSPFGMTAQALGAIENALLDIKARALDVPVYELLGGRVRDAIPVYWSHLPTWQINHPECYPPKIKDIHGVRDAGARVREQGYKALKANMYVFPDNAKPKAWHPGFGDPFEPGCNMPPDVIRTQVEVMEALREGAGGNVELAIDINFDTRTEGTLKLMRALEGFDMFWWEVDNHNPQALAYIRSKSKFPIASCETVTGVRQLLPYLQAESVDVAIIDVIWNGAWQSMKMASAAMAFDVNIAPHNFYGHLATMQSVHFAAAVPNLRIMEHDVDRLAWDDEIFSAAPEVVDSAIVVPDGPGWGVVPNEKAIRARPPRTFTYLDAPEDPRA